ncbi:MAG TPA: hypothetical protein PK812_13225 [Beijerinckiaceae bacterium]|nr:hypothetical protein [Beijerinckiaceae bacterium]
MSGSDARDMAARLLAHLETLTALVAEESHHLRKGRLREGLQLQGRKDEAALAYGSALRGLGRQTIPPGPLRTALLDRHKAFEALLAENLAVLATVRSVSESILRDLSQKLADRPGGAYGPAARVKPPAPLALSRRT